LICKRFHGRRVELTDDLLRHVPDTHIMAVDLPQPAPARTTFHA
jgi:hypothetical protein